MYAGNPKIKGSHLKESLMEKMAKDAIKETVEDVLGGREEIKGFIKPSI